MPVSLLIIPTISCEVFPSGLFTSISPFIISLLYTQITLSFLILSNDRVFQIYSDFVCEPEDVFFCGVAVLDEELLSFLVPVLLDLLGAAVFELVDDFFESLELFDLLGVVVAFDSELDLLVELPEDDLLLEELPEEDDFGFAVDLLLLFLSFASDGAVPGLSIVIPDASYPKVV